MAGVREEANRVQNWRRGPRICCVGEECVAWLLIRVLRSGGVLGDWGSLTAFLLRPDSKGKNTAPDGSLGSCCGGSGQLLPTERSPRCVKPAVICAKSLPEEPTDPDPFAHFSFFGGGFAERVRRRRSASLALVALARWLLLN